MAAFEAVGRGSIPRWGTLNRFSECGGFARDSAKVEDQVRFLARTLFKTLEPDGQAAACKAASSGFDSHRRL